VNVLEFKNDSEIRKAFELEDEKGLVQLLKKIDVNEKIIVKDREDYFKLWDTLLLRSVYYGNFNHLKWLLENGADPNLQSTGDRSPLFLSIFNVKNDYVKELFERGAVWDRNEWSIAEVILKRKDQEFKYRLNEGKLEETKKKFSELIDTLLLHENQFLKNDVEILKSIRMELLF
jgi:hypothetical protein